MKRFLALLVLALASGAAAGQSLPHGVTLDALQATRDNSTGQSLIMGTLHNDSGRLLKSVSVIFVLQDAQGAKVGQAGDITYNLPNGASWQIRVSPNQPFARFSAYEVKAE